MTLPDVLLWTALRRRQTAGLRFRRQHPIGPYGLDFYCDGMKIAFEVDGDGHQHGDQPRRDERRDQWLAARGVATIRIAARDGLQSPEDAVVTLLAEIDAILYLRSREAQLTERHTPEAPAFNTL